MASEFTRAFLASSGSVPSLTFILPAGRNVDSASEEVGCPLPAAGQCSGEPVTQFQLYTPLDGPAAWCDAPSQPAGLPPYIIWIVPPTTHRSTSLAPNESWVNANPRIRRIPNRGARIPTATLCPLVAILPPPLRVARPPGVVAGRAFIYFLLFRHTALPRAHAAIQYAPSTGDCCHTLIDPPGVAIG